MTARTRVDVEQRQILVSHHTRYVRMPADKQVGFTALQFTLGAQIIAPWIPTDVSHVDVKILTAPFKILREARPNLRTVDIAKHAAHWFYALQLVEHLRCTKVAGVPNLVAVLKAGDQHVVKESVCIRKQTDPHEFICDVEINLRQGGGYQFTP
jgi:hypothetical protein